MPVPRRRRGGSVRIDYPSGRARIDTFGDAATNGVSIWVDRPMTISKFTRGVGGTTIRLVPDGSTVPAPPRWQAEPVEPIVEPPTVEDWVRSTGNDPEAVDLGRARRAAEFLGVALAPEVGRVCGRPGCSGGTGPAGCTCPGDAFRDGDTLTVIEEVRIDR